MTNLQAWRTLTMLGAKTTVAGAGRRQEGFCYADARSYKVTVSGWRRAGFDARQKARKPRETPFYWSAGLYATGRDSGDGLAMCRMIEVAIWVLAANHAIGTGRACGGMPCR